MKVLFLSRYIYEKSMPEFSKNKTGFGLMVKDIIENISEKNEVLLITRVITNGKKINKYKILKHSWFEVIRCFSLKSLFIGINKAINSRKKVIDKIKIIYFYLDSGFVKNTIRREKPDIVHLHGVDESTIIYIHICEELKIPYIVTLHGLNGLDNSIVVSKYNKLLEKSFLQKSEKNDIPITVISTGIKKRINKYYGLKSGDNIRVVTNGTSQTHHSTDYINIREKHNIPQGNRVIICIGKISLNKNQIQIIEAYNELNNDLKSKTTLLFLGSDKMNGKLQKKVRELSLDENIIYCGYMEKEDIPAYYKQADLNVVASLAEGFGLSIIEGFVYGVPTVTFSDLDAIEDLYNEKAMSLVKKRSHKALALCIEDALKRDWDRELIKKYSKKFSVQEMALNYEKIYVEILESRKNYDEA